MGNPERIYQVRQLFPFLNISEDSSNGIKTAFANAIGAPAIVVDEFTNPAAPATAGLQVATASQVADQTVLAAAMLAPGLAALAAFPRNVTFTVAGGTAAEAPTSADIVGTDIDGNALLETVVITASAGTYEGVKAFKTLTSITKKGGTGTGATVAMGFGKKFGLSRSIKDRAGRRAVLQEVAVGAVVTTGTFATPTTSPPHGSYSPSADPDAARDYAVTYEAVVA